MLALACARAGTNDQTTVWRHDTKQFIRRSAVHLCDMHCESRHRSAHRASGSLHRVNKYDQNVFHHPPTYKGTGLDRHEHRRQYEWTDINRLTRNYDRSPPVATGRVRRARKQREKTVSALENDGPTRECISGPDFPGQAISPVQRRVSSSQCFCAASETGSLGNFAGCVSQSADLVSNLQRRTGRSGIAPFALARGTRQSDGGLTLPSGGRRRPCTDCGHVARTRLGPRAD